MMLILLATGGLVRGGRDWRRRFGIFCQIGR